MSGPAVGALGATHRLRGDVQGLRAIAVLTVVAAHAGLGLTGGYVGVDVFFVISGFLISQLLFREIARTGRISLLDFYARRARRILPAATVVIIATVGAATVWASRVHAVEIAEDGLWATVFLANTRFAAQETDYFAQGQAVSPLQHYWSLAVEEQFYLVWPLLLLACALWVGRRHVGPVLLVAVALSAGWSVWVTAAHPEAAYFSSPARAWELGVGALAAWYGPRLMAAAGDRVRWWLGVGGLVAIGLACWFFDSATAMPGYAAALPVLGSAAVLLAGLDPVPGEQPWVSRMLCLAPLRRIGDWSYSLYLWHWPLLVLPQLHVGHSLSVTTNLGLVALAVLASAITYRLVETPMRRPRVLTPWRSVALYPTALVLVMTSGWAGIQRVEHAVADGDRPPVTLTEFGVDDPAGVRMPKSTRRALVKASVLAGRSGMALPSEVSPGLLSLRQDVPDVGACEYWAGSQELCPRGDTTADRSIVVLGDSHGRMWIPALDRFAESEGWTVYYLVRPHCRPADLLVAPNLNAGEGQVCVDFNDWARDRLAEIRPELTIVAALPPTSAGNVVVDGEPLGRQRAHQGAEVVSAAYADLFGLVDGVSDHQVLLADPPFSRDDVAECLTRAGGVHLGTCMFRPRRSVARMREAMIVGARRADVPVIDPTPWVCWRQTCPAVVGSTITYRDRNHLTGTYVAELTPQLSRSLRRVLDDG